MMEWKIDWKYEMVQNYIMLNCDDVLTERSFRMFNVFAWLLLILINAMSAKAQTLLKA